MHLHHRATATALAITASLTLAACSGGNDAEADNSPTKPAPTTNTPSRSTDPSQKAKDAALRAYDKFWRAQVEAYEKGSTKGTDVAEYASGEAYVQLEQDVRKLRSAGVYKKGAPRHDTEVASYTPKRSGSLPTAKLRDCLDISSWKTIEKKSGKVVPLPSKQPRKAWAQVTAEDWGKKGGDEGWMIIEMKPSTTEC